MATWPATLPDPDWGTEDEFYKPQTKLEFDANYMQVYPRASRGRIRLPLEWSLMTETQYQALKTFFNANQGGSFTFTHPITSVSGTYVFSADSITSRWKSAGWRGGVKCPIEEL